MFRRLGLGSALLMLIWAALGSSPSQAVTAEVARKCKALTDKAYPSRKPGNPAAGSAKGTGRDAQGYFSKCVANGGNTDDSAPQQAK